MKIKKFLFLGVSFLMVGCSSTSTISDNISKANTIFVDTDSLIKTKANYEDKDGNKGTLLYAYDSGASINFGSPYNGVFKGSMASIANEFGSEDLKEYSVVFTDTFTKDQFAVKVINYSTYAYVAVCYNGQLAGINYFESEYSVGKCYGFSGIANNEGRYTKIESTKAELLFDPVSMKVQAKIKDNNYHDVWDFNNDINDGAKLETNFLPFDEYNVSIVFDKVSANGCGDLLVYNFCGYDLSKEVVSSAPIINTHIVKNAITGHEYVVPTPTVTSLTEGALSSDYVSFEVYNSKGDKLSVNNGAFIPNVDGKYYIYYKYLKDNVSSYTFALIESLSESSSFASFSEPYFDLYNGAGKIINVPDVTLDTNLGIKASTYNCVVTIKRDGQVVNEYSKVKTGFDFKFSDYGRYEFIYSHDVSEKTLTKTVIVDGRLAINHLDNKSYGIGDEFTAPKISCYKGNKESGYSTKIYAPNGNEISEEKFVLTEEGIYKVEYYLDCEVKPYVRNIVVKQKTADLFDDNDSEYGEMTTNHAIKGVKLSLQSNETVTYKNIIDLRKFGFDPNLADLKSNKEFIKLFIQPTTQELIDLEALYIVLTDAYDSTKTITIRMRYLNYFNGGCFIRAKANGQGSYVGYNYNFRSTNLEVHNANSHEEGGFQSFLNFDAHITSVDFDEIGLPLYFDNETLRLYSRPAWLTGHNNTSADNYDNIQVPWLIYDFGTDDGVLSGGNTPFKGFTNGEVYLSMYGKGISSSADVYVTSINGEKLDSEFIDDNEGPEIEIDQSEFVDNGNELVPPTGLINTEYKVFDFEAKDSKSSVYTKSVKVFDPTNKEVEVINNRFTPTSTGEYRLVFEASDAFGNTSTKEIVVNVSNNSDPLEISLVSDLPTSINYGDTIYLPKATYSGGSGNLKLDVSVTSAEGKTIDVENFRFVAKEISDSYTVSYTVTDYLNQTKTFTRNIAVQRTDYPVLDFTNVVLPPAFINNDLYVFDDITAYAYDSNYKQIPVKGSVRVTDANGTRTLGSDLKYTPKYSDECQMAHVEYIFDNGGYTVTTSSMIPILKVKTNSSNYMSSFFTSANAEITSSSNGLTFTSTSNADLEFGFVRSVNARELLLNFGLDKDKTNCSSFAINLVDSRNANEAITLNFDYRLDPLSGSNKLYCSLNDSKQEYQYNLGNENILSLSYNNTSFAINDILDSEVMKVSNYKNGDSFKGFTSNEIYFSFVAKDVTASNFAITMKKINNQVTNITRNDYQAPSINVTERVVSRVARGTTIKVPTAYCYDVLNAINDLTVTVKNSNGNVLLEEVNPTEDLYVTLNECGTYTITYTISDSNNNTAEMMYVVTVYDEVKPTLSFTTPLPSEIKLGTSINLGNFKINDDNPDTCQTYIHVYGPDGVQTEYKSGKYTFNQRGNYVVTYYVVDENNNSTMYVFHINVK